MIFSYIYYGSALQKLYLSTEIFKSQSRNYCARRNKIRAAQLKSKEDRERTSLEKSTEAWQIMTTLVLLLIKFVRSFKINIKDNWWYDITKISTPLKKILITKKMGTNRKLSHLFDKIRRIRNDLAYHLLLKKRRNSTYSRYGRIWGDLLGLIGKENEKRALLNKIKQLNKAL